MSIKLNSANGSVTIIPADGSGNVDFTVPRTGFLESAGGTMSGAIDMGSNNITTTGKILYSNMYSALSDLPSATTYHGMFAHVHATGKGYFAHGGAWIELANQTDLASTTTTANAALPKAGGALTGALTTNSTIDGRDVAADGVTADAALPKAGGAMTGAITTNSTFDGRDVSVDGTKLDGIEASATADQTAAQIKTHLENGIDSIHYVDGSIDTVHVADDAITSDKLANSINASIAAAATTGKAIAMSIVFG